MEDLTGKSTGDQLTAAEWNQLPQEVQNVITQEAIALSSGDTSQLVKALGSLVSGGDFYTDSGVADAYVLSSIGTRSAADSYKDGMRVRFRAGNANATTTPTVNVTSLGVKTITRQNGSALIAGDIPVGKDTVIRYDDSSGDFFLETEPVEADVPAGYQDELRTGNNSGDAVNDIDFFAGTVRSTDNTQTITLSSTITKQIDANWAAGTGNGGFPSGLTLTNATFYWLFVIAKPDGTTDCGFDSSHTAVNLLADATGYTVYAPVGFVYRSGGGNNRPYEHLGDSIIYDTPFNDVAVATAVPTVRTSISMTVPSGAEPIFNVYLATNAVGATRYGIVTNLSQQDVTPSITDYTVATSQTASAGGQRQAEPAGFHVTADANKYLGFRFDSAATVTQYGVQTRGVKWDRSRVVATA
jgi:hypothetical protein